MVYFEIGREVFLLALLVCVAFTDLAYGNAPYRIGFCDRPLTSGRQSVSSAKEGGTLELNRVFTFDRAGDIMHITDAPSPPAGRAHGTDDDTKAGG